MIKKKGDVTHYLAHASSPRSVVVWNVKEKTVFKIINIDLKGADKIHSVKFNSREPSMLAIASDQGIQVWDYSKAELLVSLKHPSVAVGLCPPPPSFFFSQEFLIAVFLPQFTAFSANGKRIAGVGMYRSKVKLYDTRTGKRIKKLAAGFSTGIVSIFLLFLYDNFTNSFCWLVSNSKT